MWWSRMDWGEEEHGSAGRSFSPEGVILLEFEGEYNEVRKNSNDVHCVAANLKDDLHKWVKCFLMLFPIKDLQNHKDATPSNTMLCKT